MGARSASVILFRIVYSSLYTILLILLILLLAVTPADHIYQTIRNGKFGNVFVVGITYFVTAIIAFFVYASRLYTNRTALLAIPKPYLPIEEGELGKKVRKMTVKNRQRSALIAWESRPRDLRDQVLKDREDLDEKDAARVRRTKHKHKDESLHPWILPVDFTDPPWGIITHRGWSSPTSEQTPNLHFDTVLAELPNLIEAKAVYTAPADPILDFLAPSSEQRPLQPPPDPQAVALLQRPSHMGVREYVGHLESLGLIKSPIIAESFVNRFEYARFSSVPLTEIEFIDLMAAFSDLLEAMQQPDLEVYNHNKALIQEQGSMDSAPTSSQLSVVHWRSEKLGSSSSSLRSSASVVHR